jgi:hypothetical protein
MLAAAGSAFLQERIATGEFPVTEGNYMSQWVDLIGETAESGHRTHATRLCQIFIELAYLENVEGPYERDQYGPLGERVERDSPITHGARRIREMRKRTDPSIVDKAFETMLDYEQTTESDRMVLIDDLEEEHEQNYRFTIDVGDHYALNQTDEYPELLQNLRDGSRISE